MKKRILSLFLAMVMVVGMIPSAMASETVDGALGDGVTVSNGYVNGVYYGEDGEPTEPPEEPSEEPSEEPDAGTPDVLPSGDEDGDAMLGGKEDGNGGTSGDGDGGNGTVVPGGIGVGDAANDGVSGDAGTGDNGDDDVFGGGDVSDGMSGDTSVGDGNGTPEVPVLPDLKDPDVLPSVDVDEVIKDQDSLLPGLDVPSADDAVYDLVPDAALMSVDLEDNLDLALGDVVLSGGGTYVITQSERTEGNEDWGKHNVVVSDAETYDITFDGNIEIDMNGTRLDANRMGTPGIDIAPGAVVVMRFNGAANIKAGACAAGIRVPSTAQLTIEYTNGKLVTEGGVSASTQDSRKESGAGIGGNMLENCGRITILGGDIKAVGGSNTYTGAAGIGGGGAGDDEIDSPSEERCSAVEGIYILGGTVEAIASSQVAFGAAGIGGGSTGAGRNIVIGGGDTVVNVKANAGIRGITNGGAGIGGGAFGEGSNIHIGQNARVAAKAGDYVSYTGAGIGGGYEGDGYDLLFDGDCAVLASQSTSQFMLGGAGIGGGARGNGDNIRFNLVSGGGSTNLSIEDNKNGQPKYVNVMYGGVTVMGINAEMDSGAGIGGGAFGDGTNIVIEGTGYVNAAAVTTGAGIGGGSLGYAEHIYIRGCTVAATAGTGANATRTGAGIGGGTGDHPNKAEMYESVNGFYGWANDIQITGGSVNASSLRGAAAIGGGKGGYGTNILISGEGGNDGRTRVNAYTAGDPESNVGAAAIGGGHNAYGANITIRGSVGIDANQGYCAASVGGGRYGFGVNILVQDVDTTISYGTSGYGVRVGDIGSGEGATDGGFNDVFYAGINDDGTMDEITVDYSAYAGGPDFTEGFVVPANVYVVNSNVYAGGIGSNRSNCRWTWYGVDDSRNVPKYVYVPVVITGGKVYAAGMVGSKSMLGGYISWNGNNVNAEPVSERYTQVDVKVDENCQADLCGLGSYGSTDFAIVNIQVSGCNSFISRDTVGIHNDSQNVDLGISITDCEVVDITGTSGYRYSSWDGSRYRERNGSSGSTSATGTAVGIGTYCHNVAANISVSGCEDVRLFGTAYSGCMCYCHTSQGNQGVEYRGVTFGVGAGSYNCTFDGSISGSSGLWLRGDGHMGSGEVGIGGNGTIGGTITVSVDNIGRIGRPTSVSSGCDGLALFGLFHGDGTDCDITVSNVDEIIHTTNSYDVRALASAVACRDSDVDIKMTNVGLFSYTDSQGSWNYNHGSAVFGSNYCENSDVDVVLTNCGDVSLDLRSLGGLGVAFGSSHDTNTRTAVSLVSNSETDYPMPSIDMRLQCYDYGYAAIGSAGSAYNDSSKTASVNVCINNYGNIGLQYYNYNDWGLGYGGSVFLGFKNVWSSVAGKRFDVGVTLDGCGDISMSCIGSGPAMVGIGSAYCYGSFNGDVTVKNCGTVSLGFVTLNESGVVSGWQTYSSGPNCQSMGIGCANGYSNWGNIGQFSSDVRLENVDGIHIDMRHWGIGIGAYHTYANSSNVTVSSNVELDDCGDIDIRLGDYCVGIGDHNCQGSSTFMNPGASSGISITNSGNIRIGGYTDDPPQYSTGIGVGGSSSNYQRRRDLSIFIDNCGDIDIGEYYSAYENSNAGEDWRIGIGFLDVPFNNNGKESSITISNCGNIDAVGSQYGPGIGYGRYAGNAANASIKLVNNQSVSARSFTGHNWANGSYSAAAIGSCGSFGSSSSKREIVISGSPVTAVAGDAVAIGTGRDSNGGALTVTLSDIPSLHVDNTYGAVVGQSRDNASTRLTLTLDDVVFDGDVVSKGYGAGIGNSIRCSNCQTSLYLNDVTIPLAKGANGGAGIGAGPVNAQGNMNVNIVNGSIVAEGSAANENLFEVFGSTGNAAQDTVNEKILLGAGAGIGGSDSSMLVGINIDGGFDEEGRRTTTGTGIVARGAAIDDMASAGIGGGSGNAAEVFIRNNVVEAYGGGEGSEAGGAGIGSGSKKDNGNVALVNSKVVAHGGNGSRQGGAGIGSGGGSTQAGSIQIVGDCEIWAYGSDRGAGIGGGSRSNGACIEIMSDYDDDENCVNNDGQTEFWCCGTGTHNRPPKIYAYSGILDSAAIGGGAASLDQIEQGYSCIAIYDQNNINDPEASCGVPFTGFESPVEIYMYGYAGREAFQGVYYGYQPLFQGTVYEPVGELGEDGPKAVIELSEANDDVEDGKNLPVDGVPYSGVIPSGYSAFSFLLPDSEVGKTFNTYMHQTDWLDGHGADTKMVQLVDEKGDFSATAFGETKALQLTLVQYYPVTFVATVADDPSAKVLFEDEKLDDGNRMYVRSNYQASVPNTPMVANGGWVFGGWFVDEERTVPYDFTKPVTGPITLYADWLDGEGLPYEIHHYKQSVADADTYELALTEIKLAPAGRTVRGEYREFEGFNEVIKYDETNGLVTSESGVIPEMKDGRLILKLYYDRKNYTVKLVNFDPLDGQPTELTGPYGSAVSLFIPSKQYYDFVGWTKVDADGDDVATFVPVRIETLSDTLFANWEIREGAQYKVRYYLRGLDGNYRLHYTEDKAVIGEAIMSPVTATVYDYEGYELNHSISDETMTDMIREDGKSVLRVYYDLVDVYVKLNDADMPDGADIVVREYSDVANLPTPNRAGYVFQGWFREDGIRVKAKDTINECGTNGTHAGTEADPYQVTARWTPVEQGVTYSVEYYTQNAKGEYVISMLERVIAQSGSSVSVEPRKMSGYTFNEEKSNISAIVSGDGSTVLQLYYDIQSYPVHFESNGGSSVPTQEGVFFGGVASEPADPAKTGYVFDGWYGDSGLAVKWNFLRPILGETTLYAKWVPGDVEYRVRHFVETTDGAGYKLVDTEVLTAKTESTVSAVIRDYDGCIENAIHPDRVVSGTVLADGSLVLDIYYQRRPVTVAYETLGGNDIPDQVYKFGATADDLLPTRAGYDFAGWYSNASCTKPFDFDTMLMRDIVLWAKWTPRDDTPYRTEHWLQSVEDPDVYVLEEAVDDIGRTEKVVHAKVKDYEGFHQNEDHRDSNLTEEVFGDGSTVLKVYYDRDMLAVRFDTDGGEFVDGMEVPYGGSIGDVATTKTGYAFGGWYADKGLTEGWDADDAVLESMTLYAKWVPVDGTAYAVEHWLQDDDLKGYSLARTTSGTGVTDSEATATAETFYGFAEDEDAPKRVASGTIKADGSLVLRLYYDRVEFDVEFDSEGGSDVASVKAVYGRSVAEPKAPRKTGYVFDGWYTSELYDEAFAFGEEPVMGDMVLYARWVPASGVRYTVKYYKQAVDKSGYEEAGYEELSGTTGSTVSADVKMAKGFTVNLEHPDTMKQGVVAADGSLVLELYYDRNDYVVTFDPQNGGEQFTRTVTYGALVGDGPEVSRTGYVLSGWETGDGIVLDGEYAMPDGDVTFFAIWDPDTVGYSVEHYRESLSGGYDLFETDAMEALTGSTVSVSAKDYAGFTEDTSVDGRAATGIVAADGSLVLKLYYGRRNYTVSFVSNNGTSVEPQCVKYGGNASEPDELSRQGYVFAGWYSDEAMVSAVDFGNYVVTGDMVMRAKWVPATDTPYVVKYMHQSVDRDGWFAAKTVAKAGTTGTTAVAEPMDFYGFVEDTGNAQRLPEAEIKADGTTVLKLYYDRVDWTVGFESNGGNEITSQSVVHGGLAAEPRTPSRTGYVFDGWYRDAVFSDAVDFGEPVESDVTYYAKWTPASGITYTAEYWQESLSGVYAKVSEMTLSLDGTTESIVEAPVPELEGFTFNPDAEGSRTSGEVLPDGSLVLSVYYGRNTYRLIVDARNGSASGVYDLGYDAVVVLPESVEYEGYEFQGWYDEDGRAVDAHTRMPARDMTVSARWTGASGVAYTVEYYGRRLDVAEGVDGAYDLLKSEPYQGTTGQEVEAPVGIFPGYVLDESAEGTVRTGTVANDGSLVLKLFYDRETYTVKFVDGDRTEEQKVTFGQTLGDLPAATKDGYTFDGWFDGTTKAEAGMAVTKDMTFTAKWTRQSTSGGGGGGGSYTPAPKPEEPVKTIDEVDVPLAGLELLRDDHVAYVSGFPDGTVRPTAYITRAEVAMMFYRLMREQAVAIYGTDEHDFIDVESGSWCERAIATLANAGILEGRGGNIFDPNARITRVEFTVICARFDEADVGDVDIEFTDVDKDAWYYNLVMRAAAKGWVEGYGDDKFGPMDNITRAEAVTLVNRMTNRAVDKWSNGDVEGMKAWPDNKDTEAWYYIAIQEATHTHESKMRDGIETWTSLKSE